MPDGAIREVPLGTTAAEIAQQISPRLAKEALVARVAPIHGPAAAAASASTGAATEKSPDAAPEARLTSAANGEGFLVDLRAPIDQDVRLSILTPKDPEAIQVLRHSAAHLLAAAVLELFPNVKLGIGPPIDTGFFYDFVRAEPFTPEDLERIEKKMRELAAQDIPNERKMMPKPEAHRAVPQMGSGLQVRTGGGERAIEPMVSFYTTGKFIDFCRGPHIPSHRTHSRVQADERRGRLLERPGRQSADAAHLRRVLLHAAGAGRISAPARRSQAARSSPARAGARSVFAFRKRPGRD